MCNDQWLMLKYVLDQHFREFFGSHLTQSSMRGYCSDLRIQLETFNIKALHEILS